jgi:hypothetical protein
MLLGWSLLILLAALASLMALHQTSPFIASEIAPMLSFFIRMADDAGSDRG